MRRGAVERLGPSQHIVAEALDTLPFILAGSLLRYGRGCLQSGFARIDPVRMMPFPLGNRRCQLRGKIAFGPLRQRITPRLTGVRMPKLLQEAGLHQKHGKIERRDGKKTPVEKSPEEESQTEAFEQEGAGIAAKE